MSISQATCNHWHPNEPSEIKMVRRSDLRGGVGEVCATCKRSRQRVKYLDKNAPNAPGHFTQTHRGTDYGVLPRLSWPAPEFLLRQ